MLMQILVIKNQESSLNQKAKDCRLSENINVDENDLLPVNINNYDYKKLIGSGYYTERP